MGSGKQILIHLKKHFVILVLAVLVFTQSGCALLKLPGAILSGTFSLIGKIFRVVDKLPKPPPGVF
jgi:hypothetical protein